MEMSEENGGDSPLELDVKLELGAEDSIDEEMQDFSSDKGEKDDPMDESESNLKEGEDGESSDKQLMGNEKECFSDSELGEFSSEKFKILLRNLPKRYAFSRLKNTLIKTLHLKLNKFRCGTRNRSLCMVSFEDEESLRNAFAILNGYEFQGSKIEVEIVKPSEDCEVLDIIDCLNLPEESLDSLPFDEQIEKKVIPLASYPYEKQLASKNMALFQILRKFSTEMVLISPELSQFFKWHEIRRKGGICEIDDIVKSPILEGYWNKCEFTIGKSSGCTTPIIGFELTGYLKGSIEVCPIDHLRHINPKIKLVVKLMETFLKNSNYETFDPFSRKGVWRQLCVRASTTGDLMLILQIHPQEMDTEDIDKIKEDLMNFFTVGEGANASVTSFFFQQIKQLENETIENELLFGKEFIEETIMGKTFKASPDAFLMINAPGYEALCGKVLELSEIDPTTVLLDICCGIGTIGICLAESAYKVIGIETNANAVLNARENAENNGIENAVFNHGKAEDCMESTLGKSQFNNCIAVIDLPPAGLANSVIDALRKCDYLNKIVYISCNLPEALENFQALCKPLSKLGDGSHFIPIRACAFDLFPDTRDFGAIVVFERYDECKWDRIMAGNPRPKDQDYFNRVPPISREEEENIRKKRKRSAKKKRMRKRDNSRMSQRRREKRRERDMEYRRRVASRRHFGYEEGYKAALEDMVRISSFDFNYSRGRNQPYQNKGPSPFNLPRNNRDNIPPLLPDLPSRSSSGGNQWNRSGTSNANQGPKYYPSNCGNNAPEQNINNQWNNQGSNFPNMGMGNQNTYNPPNNWMMNSGPGNQGNSWGTNNQSQQGGPWGVNQSQQGGSWVDNNQPQGRSWTANNESQQDGSYVNSQPSNNNWNYGYDNWMMGNSGAGWSNASTANELGTSSKKFKMSN